MLITGAAGFIGAGLARRLLEEDKNAAVVGIDDLNDYYDVSLKEHRLAQIRAYPNFTFVKADIADKAAVQDLFRRCRPDVVVNLAAQAGVRCSIENPDAYIRSNLIGFYNILEACRHSYDGGAPGMRHMVFASSSSVYGANKKVPYSTEDKVDDPVSLYAATKKATNCLPTPTPSCTASPARGCAAASLM